MKIFAVIVCVFLMAGAIGVTIGTLGGSYARSIDTTRDLRLTNDVYIDQATGCEYLRATPGPYTPRMEGRGESYRQRGCR